MEQENVKDREYRLGKLVIMLILVGTTLLEVCNIGFSIVTKEGYLGAGIGVIVWGLLLWQLYKGAIWARYIVIIILWLSLIPALAVLGVIG